MFIYLLLLTIHTLPMHVNIFNSANNVENNANRINRIYTWKHLVGQPVQLMPSLYIQVT